VRIFCKRLNAQSTRHGLALQWLRVVFDEFSGREKGKQSISKVSRLNDVFASKLA
jgi:hypothetical protein